MYTINIVMFDDSIERRTLNRYRIEASHTLAKEATIAKLDRRKKYTVAQIRKLFPFDKYKLAEEAGVAIETFAEALRNYPVTQEDADKIVRALTQFTGCPYLSECLDIVVQEKFLILWIVRASASEAKNKKGETRARYKLVYARSKAHAANLVRSWLKDNAYYDHQTFTACSEGFRVGDIIIPGYVSIPKRIVSN